MPDRRYLRADVVAHADWSKDPRKRWVAIARWRGDRFVADIARPAWADREYFDQLGPALAGFDFPIGLPWAYASRAGITSFVNALPYLSETFYTIAERPEQISLQRPFYPRVPGGTSQADLVVGLGFWSESALLRRCEVQCKAAPLFWTLGARQPGRAAIAGWRDLLGPAVRRRVIRIWPFEGTLNELLGIGVPVVVESYPAEAYTRLGISRGFGKNEQGKRARAGSMMLDWAEYFGVEVTAPLREQANDGFGADDCGEDRFDAVAGLFGMLDLALGISPCVEPEESVVREVEGWIIGLKDEAHKPAGAAAAPAGDSGGQL